MEKTKIEDLPWRERQIVEVIYRLGEATAAQIQAEFSEEISNSAIRAMLARLEDKGVLKHREEAQRYIYQPIERKERVADSALKKIVGVFFEDSPASAASALLGMADRLSSKDIDQLQALIDKARKEGR